MKAAFFKSARLLLRACGLWLALVAVSTPAAAPWQSADTEADAVPEAERWVRPRKSRAFRLDHAALRETIARAPREFTPAARTPIEISLPMPDGTQARFRICESPIMAPELAAQYPEIKTYCGQGIDDPTATVRFDITPSGLHAQILSGTGAIYVDPARRGDARLHVSYHKRDFTRDMTGFECFTPGAGPGGPVMFQPAAGTTVRSGSSLRTYRLAVSATGEYTQFHGGTVAAGLAAVVTAINRVNGIYETELAIRLVLVANNNLLIFTNPSTDPFSNTNPNSLLSQNQSTVDSIIGEANYDVAHVFSTGGGGLSRLAVVCIETLKAQSETGLPSPVGDPFVVDFVAHEIGHEFGANHTFNGIGGNCGGQLHAATAYEPGSGSTIMAYAGICLSDDLQPHSDAFFHSSSVEEIQYYTTINFGKDCAVVMPTGNSAPALDAGPDCAIPKGTPFTLTAMGSDPNGDAITFCWEELDHGTGQSLTTADNGSIPLFRCFPPTISPARTFPRWSDILNNTASSSEKLPATSRSLNFRVTARDNRAGGGGVTTDDMLVTVVGSAGPFIVTSPNTAVTWSGTRTVTWNVAGTTAAPMNAAAVDILLSTNGGATFSVVLASNTPNDGSEMVQLPNLATSQARIKIQAVGNIFFDVSDANFTINTFIPSPQITIDSTALLAEDCAPANGVIDPGEIVTVNLALRNVGSAPTTNLTAALLAIGGIVPLSSTQNFGALAPGGPATVRSFTFLSTASCGAASTMAFQLADNLVALPAVTKSFTPGVQLAVTNSAANTAAITISSRDAATPYPSGITVSGLPGAIAKVSVTLSNLSHTQPDDLDILLVGPGGQSVVLMSDVGGTADISNVTLTFDDAGVAVPDSSALSGGVWKPTNIGDESFASPAPAGPYGSALSVFNGLSPNGVWSLYVFDDAVQHSGSIVNGWRLSFVTQTPAICCSNLPVPTLAIADTAVVEGNSGRVDASFPVRLSRPPAQAVTVHFATSDGTAIGGTDYASTNGTVQFGVGVTNQTLRVGVLGDTLFEGNETFSVLLDTPVNATISHGTGIGTILDDETRLTAVRMPDKSVKLSFNSVTGATYRIESSDELPAAGGWTPLPGATLFPGTGGLLEVLATNGLAQPQRFYRVRQLTP